MKNLYLSLTLVIILVIILIIYIYNSFYQYSKIDTFTSGPKKVAICFFGLTRSLNYTLDSIEENIFTPLKNSNIKYDIILHTYNLKFIKMERSGENNKLNTEEWKLLNPDYYKIDNQDEFDNSYNYEYIKKFGDAWNTNFQNTKNFIRQLNSLKQVFKLAKNSKSTYDCYLFIRPDLKYTKKLDVTQIYNASMQNKSIFIPSWHKWGGVNDRMALGCHNTIKFYANRLDDVSDYLETTKKPLHAEKFLKFVLKKHNIKTEELDLVGKRVRSNGKIPSIDQKL